MAVVYIVKKQEENLNPYLHIKGKAQVCDLATSVTYANQNNKIFREEFLKLKHDKTEINAIRGIVRKVTEGKSISNLAQAEEILKLLGFTIQEIKTY